MKAHRILLLLLFTVFFSPSVAARMVDSTQVEIHSLRDFFQNGSYHIHIRMRGMSTFNQKDLQNYGALGFGGGLAYYSPEWNNFHIGLSGFFTFRLLSSDLSPDPLTQVPNRYEIMLFDAKDFENSNDLDRMEELYIKYSPGKASVTIGRQYINTPLLNGQDNRMRPNIFQGALGEWHGVDHLRFSLGWINRISPRGTVEWYSMEESIGVYNSGRYLNGQPSNYYGNVSSKGVALLGAQYTLSTMELSLWNYFAENIFNTTFSQINWIINPTWKMGFQAAYQAPIGEGGNEDSDKSYILDHEKVFVWGAQLQGHWGKNLWSWNYLQIGEQGRFLFPREWGREQFFANLPRDRFEGVGGVKSLMTKWETEPFTRWKWAVGTSINLLPKEHEFFLNKYGLTSYMHYYSGLNYQFGGKMEGLEMQFVGVYKQSISQSPVTVNNLVNKVNMAHVDLVLDYHF